MIKSVARIRLIYQIGTVVLLGVFISFFLSMHLLSSERDKNLTSLSSSAAIQRVISIVEILKQSPSSLHASIIQASSSTDLSLSISSTPHITESKNSGDEILALQSRLKTAGLAQANLSLVQRSRAVMGMGPMRNIMMSDPIMRRMHTQHMGYISVLDGSVKLTATRWLNFSSGINEDITHWSSSVLIAITLVMLATLSISLFIIHRALHPITVLGKAASEFAQKRKITPVSETCPDDLRPAIKAFNQMQYDIDEYIRERTRLLGAISHDLRTPLTSLRLRLEFIEESDDKKQMLESVSVMEKMLKATIGFAKEDSHTEERQLTNIDNLLQTIVDEYADKGTYLEYQEQKGFIEMVPPIAIRRMLENLINNAVQYGGEGCKITLGVVKRSETIEFTVSDTGIGITESDLKEVIKPFTRLDNARDTAGSNVGLGLSITQSLASNYGGKLTLRKNEPTGLVCIVTLSCG